MRRTCILLVFLAVLLVPSATAQPEVSVRGNVGAAFFQSPEGYNDVLNSGIDLGLGAGLQVYRGLEIVVQGSYDRFTLNGDNLALANDLSVGTNVDGGGLNVLNATIGLRYTVQSQGDVHPYAAGGIGLYRSVVERTFISQGDQTLPRQETVGKGYHVAIGSNFQIDDTYSFFFEPRLVIVDTKDTDLDTTTSTRYVTVRLGIEMQLGGN